MSKHRSQQSEQHLRHAKAEHHFAQSHQLRQIEFKTDDKHQQHHAEFGHRSHRFFALLNQSPALAQKNACQQIAQNSRQMQQTAANHADNGEQQVNQCGIYGAHLWR